MRPYSICLRTNGRFWATGPQLRLAMVPYFLRTGSSLSSTQSHTPDVLSVRRDWRGPRRRDLLGSHSSQGLMNTNMQVRSSPRGLKGRTWSSIPSVFGSSDVGFPFLDGPFSTSPPNSISNLHCPLRIARQAPKTCWITRSRGENLSKLREAGTSEVGMQLRALRPGYKSTPNAPTKSCRLTSPLDNSTASCELRALQRWGCNVKQSAL